MTVCYIGLGSNLDHPEQQIAEAVDALQALPESALVALSSLYQTPPMGPRDQPDYLNAVAEVETTLAPLPLLDQLQEIESRQGRVRTRRWGERTIDLDLLLYGEQTMNHPRLQLPHPGIAQRSFVLVPLQEVAGPDLQIPAAGVIHQLLSRCDCSDIKQRTETI